MVGKSTRKKDINKQANKNKWTSENVGDSKSEIKKQKWNGKKDFQGQNWEICFPASCMWSVFN